MKKFFYFFAFFISIFSCAQSSYTEAQVERSTDPQVIATFIKLNPNNPRTPEFKRKLIAAINNNKSAPQKAKVAQPTIKPLTPAKLQNAINRDVAKNGVTEKQRRTADLLTHLFSNDPSGTTAYVQIINKSKCNLIVRISGKKFYNLDVPANNQNFLSVEKGTYTLTTSVCDAKYTSVKNIGKDIVVTLNAGKK